VSAQNRQVYEKALDRVGASVVGDVGHVGWAATGAFVAGGVSPSRV